MSLPSSEASAGGNADQTPVGSGVVVSPTLPALSDLEAAVQLVGGILDRAYGHALRVDHLARLIVETFNTLTMGERVALGDQHPKLVEQLLQLDDVYYRVDNP